MLRPVDALPVDTVVVKKCFSGLFLIFIASVDVFVPLSYSVVAIIYSISFYRKTAVALELEVEGDFCSWLATSGHPDASFEFCFGYNIFAR